MKWDGEDVLGAVPPMGSAVMPEAGQKMAGWVLRICGALMFVLGACCAVIWLSGMIAILMGVTDDRLIFLAGAYVAGGFALMIPGSLLGSFGAWLTGLRERVEGRDFMRWALLEIARNTSWVFGGLLLLATLGWVVQGIAVAAGWVLLATVLWLSGAKAHRAIKRFERG